MKLLIVTTRKDISCYRIVEESKKKGIEVTKLFYEDLDVQGDFDFCILRDPYNTGVDYSAKLKKLAKRFGNEVLDYKVYKNYPDYEDKLFQDKMFKNWAPRFWHNELKMAFPVVVKKRISSRGKDVFVFNNVSEINSFFKKRDIKNYVFEEFVDIKDDVRVVVIGDEIICSVKRRFRFKENKSIGVKVIGKYKLPEKIKEKVVKAAKKLGADFYGFDIFIGKNGKDYLGEINISPQFIATERVLGINIAKKLIEFILK